MTAYNNQPIMYEGQTITDGVVSGTPTSGNPIRYNNGTQWGFSWSEGRNLKVATKSSTTFTFQYDASGLRTQKNSANSGSSRNSTYLYAGGKLLRETRAVSVYHGPSSSSILDFTYDAAGAPYSLIYNNGRTTATYYYITNLQGDVMYLVDETGAEVAAYTYDPYGKVLSATGTMAGVNPLRYRGYYQDSETGFYYLQSRYYDPEIGRFINADGFVTTSQNINGYNMFAYCNNNPINRMDPTGHSLIAAFVATAVALVCILPLSGCSALPKPPSDFVEDYSAEQNCYSYAFGLPHAANPGGYSASSQNPDVMSNNKKIYTVEEVAKFVMRDMEALNIPVRVVDSPSDRLDNEYIVALKTSTTVAPNAEFGDYHFAMQLSDGTWADKPGTGSARWNALDGTAMAWDYRHFEGYYDSETVYFAVTR